MVDAERHTGLLMMAMAWKLHRGLGVSAESLVRQRRDHGGTLQLLQGLLTRTWSIHRERSHRTRWRHQHILVCRLESSEYQRSDWAGQPKNRPLLSAALLHKVGALRNTEMRWNPIRSQGGFESDLLQEGLHSENVVLSIF
jgi:hypothetical protein